MAIACLFRSSFLQIVEQWRQRKLWATAVHEEALLPFGVPEVCTTIFDLVRSDLSKFMNWEKICDVSSPSALYKARICSEKGQSSVEQA